MRGLFAGKLPFDDVRPSSFKSRPNSDGTYGSESKKEWHYTVIGYVRSRHHVDNMATGLTPEARTPRSIHRIGEIHRITAVERHRHEKTSTRRTERVSSKAEADTIQSVLLLVPELELEPAPGLVPAPILEHGGLPPLVGHIPASKAVIVVLSP